MKQQTQEQKDQLILALEAERLRLSKRVQNFDTSDHDYAINFLKHGTLPSMGIDQFEMLDAVVNDFEQTYKDYVTNP